MSAAIDVLKHQIESEEGTLSQVKESTAEDIRRGRSAEHRLNEQQAVVNDLKRALELLEDDDRKRKMGIEVPG